MSTKQLISVSSESDRFGGIYAEIVDGVPSSYTRDTVSATIDVGCVSSAARAFFDIPITLIPVGSQIIAATILIAVSDTDILSDKFIYYGHLPHKPSEINDQSLYHYSKIDKTKRIVTSDQSDGGVALNLNQLGINLLQSALNSGQGWFGMALGLSDEDDDDNVGTITFDRSAGVLFEVEYLLPLTSSIWAFDRTLNDDNPLSKHFEVFDGEESYAKIQKYDVTNNELVIKYGLQFAEGVYYSAGNDFNFGNDGCSITIAFNWFSPSALGRMKHIITKHVTPIVAPIIAKATSTITDGVESVSDCEFVVNEIGYSDTQNAIQLVLFDSSNTKLRQYISEPYTPGLHTVYIVIETNSYTLFSHLRIDIDGKTGPIIRLASNVGPTGASLTLNKVSVGYTAHKTTQLGILTDLIVGNVGGVLDSEYSYKYTLFGGKYLVSDGYSLSKFNFNGVSFKRNETVSTNQILSEGNNIYVARSNGEIQKGFQSIWTNEYNYITPSEVSRLNVKDANKHGTVEWSPDGLNITGATVRV